MTDYATVTQFKQAASDFGIETKGDTNITRLLTAASRAIDRYVSRSRPRTFAAETDTIVKFHALGSVIGTILYTHLDIAQTPTTVSNNGTTVTVDTGYMLLSSEPPNKAPYTALQLINDTTWTYTTNPVNAISITARWAYSVTPPDDVIQATIQLCVMVWRQRNTVANINTAMISGDGTLVLPDGFPKSVADMLEPYVV